MPAINASTPCNINQSCPGKSRFIVAYLGITGVLERSAQWLPALCVRTLLAWEFLESGLAKYHGQNWFADIAFPFPFNWLPVDVSWGLATYLEILGAAALLLGVATRFFTLSLMTLTVVAIIAVHAPDHPGILLDWLKGYRIVDEAGDGFGNYKLPLFYLVMFLPLLLGGAGKWSIDHVVKQRLFDMKA